MQRNSAGGEIISLHFDLTRKLYSTASVMLEIIFQSVSLRSIK